jgi:hypothetical protein
MAQSSRVTEGARSSAYDSVTALPDGEKGNISAKSAEVWKYGGAQ